MDRLKDALRLTEDRRKASVEPYPFPPLESVEYFDLNEYKKMMKSAVSSKDLGDLISKGVDAILYLGSFYKEHNYPLDDVKSALAYSYIKNALVSASKGDWKMADEYVTSYSLELQDLFKDVPV